MDRAGLPVELCEQIIDFTATEPPLWTTREEYETFRRCALVCRAWLPRSQWNLFYSIHLNKASQVDRLLAVLAANPSLAACIQYVHVGDFLLQRASSSGPFTKDGYIPFATGRLTRALRNARVFRLTGLTWPSYPPVYTSLFRQFKSLTELQLNSVTFGSAGDVIRMAWNCPALESLTLEYIRIAQPTSETESARLMGARRPNACCNLRSLTVEDWYDSDATPPLLALGDTVTSLKLSFNTAEPWRTGGRILDMVSHYHALETVQLTITFAGLEPASTKESASEPHCNTPLFGFLSRIQPENLQKLSLFLRPHVIRRTLRDTESELEEEIPGEDIPMRTYSITRSQMASEVVGRDIKSVLDCARFTRLTEFQLEIEDDVWTHDSTWWLARLEPALPGWPEYLGVKINAAPDDGVDISELWLDGDA